MLFATTSLARRIERAESTLITDFARPALARLGGSRVFIRCLGSGAAVAAGPTAPFSKIVGLGFEPLDERALDEIEREFAERSTPVRVELSTLADPDVAARLTARGYRLIGFENVLGRSLDGLDAAASHVAVRAIPAAEARAWIDVVATAFSSPDIFDAPPSQEVVDRGSLDATFAEISEVPGIQLYLASIDGRVTGGASVRLSEGVAQLCGAGTLPAERRRGVQTALLLYRLTDAAARGCDLAVVTTQPGSVSQQNVQRAGFELLYARAILVLNP
jgi:GNAT superfamily N-acetyltransferase